MEAMVSIECLFPKSMSAPRTIIGLVIALLLPTLRFSIVATYWGITVSHDRAMLRRRLVLPSVVVLFLSYNDFAQNLSNAFSCLPIDDGTQTALYWTRDTDVECFKGSHAITLAVLVIPLVLTALLAFPFASAYYLHLKRLRGELQDPHVLETFGFMYGAYKDTCVFWDCVIMMRKALLGFLVVFKAPMGDNLQGLAAVCILVASLFLQTQFAPYSDAYPMLNSLESFSLLVSVATFFSALFAHDERLSNEGATVLSVLALILIGAFVFFALFVLRKMSVEYFRLFLRNEGVGIKEDCSDYEAFVKWARCQWRKAGRRGVRWSFKQRGTRYPWSTCVASVRFLRNL